VERAKPARQSKQPESAAERLDQIESAGDRLAGWIGENAKTVMIVAAVFLVCAAAYGLWQAAETQGGEEASIALAAAQHGFRRDMGTAPNDLIVAEPANQATADAVRTQYLTQFREVVDQHAGSTQAGIAGLEAGDIAQALGDQDAAIASWTDVAESASNPTLQGLALTRLGWAMEEQGRWPEAAARYRAAGDLQDFPLRDFALGDAVRSYRESGDLASARSVATDLAQRPDRAVLPGHIQTQLAELNTPPAAPISAQ
jgi:predicted negative regulator of RcsB-dependent stress response